MPPPNQKPSSVQRILEPYLFGRSSPLGLGSIGYLPNDTMHRSTQSVQNHIDRDDPSWSFGEPASQPVVVPPDGSKYSHLVLASRPPLESTIHLHETQHQVHDGLGNAYGRGLGISPISQPPFLRICNPSFFILSLRKAHLAKYQVRPKYLPAEFERNHIGRNSSKIGRNSPSGIDFLQIVGNNGLKGHKVLEKHNKKSLITRWHSRGQRFDSAYLQQKHRISTRNPVFSSFSSQNFFGFSMLLSLLLSQNHHLPRWVSRYRLAFASFSIRRLWIGSISIFLDSSLNTKLIMRFQQVPCSKYEL